MRYILFFFLLGFFGMLYGQVADFENFNIEKDEWLDGSDLSGGFESGGIFLPNHYNQDYLSWTGFAISATTDTLTPGFSNQYSSITGSGVNDSKTYAVRYDFVPSTIVFNDPGQPIEGMYLTNSTYAFHSVRDGDAFAKKFGGETGDDPDWFRVTIKGYRDGQVTADSTDFYLADYRFEDNNRDYIIDEWTWVDLTGLGSCDSLWLDLQSSDVGMFGMNTPAYFCIDNITLDKASSTRSIHVKNVSIYPNPATDIIRVSSLESSDLVRITDSKGRVVFNATIWNGEDTIDVSGLQAGSYHIWIESDPGTKTGTFIKF